MTRTKEQKTGGATMVRQSNRTTGRGSRGSAAPGPLYGTPTNDTDPAEILLEEIRRTAGHVQWLAKNLQESDPHQFVRGLWLAKRQSGFIKEDEIDTGDLSQAGAMWLELYMTERRHLATICRTALAAGIEERRVRLAERQAERLGDALRSLLFDLSDAFQVDLDPEDDRVRSLVYKCLMTASGLQGADSEPAQGRQTLRLSIEE